MLQVGALFEIRQHFKPGFSNQLREVAGVQTNCVWTIIHGDPEHEVSKANYGKGYRTEFGKARDYEFGETIKWYEGNAAFRDSKLIMEFVVLVPIESREIHPASAIGLIN
ncbi:hypothetical protein [Paenibacillus sp. Y412MC10]|uniref:hypothetical protein n=1 Tax=Geobacillus sp. (strain Y412MC10) TaxID=481743 RepID=UPI001642D015|nr:hypothetical protein [Paenibacillus sp. Y412MC10]